MFANLQDSTTETTQQTQKPLVQSSQELMQKINPRMATEPAYRMGWHESRLAHQQILQQQQGEIQQELVSAKKIYREVFRLASELRLQSDQCQEQLKAVSSVSVSEVEQRLSVLIAQMECRIADLSSGQDQFSDGVLVRQQKLAAQMESHLEVVRRDSHNCRAELTQLQLKLQEALLTQHRMNTTIQDCQHGQNDLGNRAVSLLLEQTRQSHELKDLDQSMVVLDSKIQQSDEAWKRLESDSKNQLQRMESQLVEHQRLLFRNESLQEQTENALEGMDAFRFEMHQAWEQQTGRFGTQESMLSQLLLEGQRNQDAMQEGFERMGLLQLRQDEAQTQWMGLSQQMVTTHQSMEALQARSQLALARAEESLTTSRQDREEAHQASQKIRQVHQEYIQDSVQLRQNMHSFGKQMVDLDQQLSQGNSVASHLLELGQRLESSVQLEQDARHLLEQQVQQNRQLQDSCSRLMQQVENVTQREKSILEQLQQAQEQSLVVQQRLDAQERVLNLASEREEEWRRMLREQTDDRIRQAAIMEEQEAKLLQAQKVAQQALRRLKETELSQRESQINQKEHQWLMNQTRQEQSQLHRERQSMQTQVQDLEAQLHELALAMNEKTVMDWKPTVDQLHTQLLEFRVEVAKVKQVAAQWDASKKQSVQSNDSEESKRNRRWWN